MAEKKLQSLAEAATLVEDGMTVALGGMSTQFHPMAFVRELARRRVKGLTVVAMVGGIDVDLLCAAGCVSTAVIGLCSFEGFGLAPSFRRQAESGRIRVEEYSENILWCRFQAAARGLPFMPTRAGMGTSIEVLNPETVRHLDSPWGPVLACSALQPDVSVVHVHEADEFGNARLLPKPIWLDVDVAQAGKRLIITAERIIPHQSFRDDPYRTTFSGFTVDAVVHTTRGSHPCALPPDYPHDAAFYAAYQEAAAAGRLDGFLENDVLLPEPEYLKRW
jgi:glutaconate CoA-transferase subunit A